MNDRVEGFAFDFLSGKTGIILEDYRFAGQAISKNTTAFLDLQFFSARHGDTQAHGDGVGDVVAANGEDAALFNGAADIKEVTGGAAADIDHQRPEVFLMLG